MVDIICPHIKETSTRCITIRISIMIFNMDTITKASRIEVAVEAAVASSMLDVVVVTPPRSPRPIKVGKLTMNNSRVSRHSRMGDEARPCMARCKGLGRSSNSKTPMPNKITSQKMLLQSRRRRNNSTRSLIPGTQKTILNFANLLSKSQRLRRL